MRTLGKGHRERVYHRAMITALNKAGVAHRSEVECPIWFMGECVGVGRADLVIQDVVVEIKANKSAPTKASPQILKYISSLNKLSKKIYRGIIVNFNQITGSVDIYTGESELFQRSVSAKSRKEPPKIFKRQKNHLETPWM